MQPLDKPLRTKLEKTVEEARDVAETAARAALEQLGVGEAAPHNHLNDSERELRRKLRAHGRQLGDVRNGETEKQEFDRLLEEVAYEHWHRMLFARFLAENNLLMYPDPDDPVAVTLAECEDLAAGEGAKNGWELASRFAARMLPQIFRPDSPVFQLELPPEHQQKLKRLVTELPVEIFTASDSLGWVYQFWQARKKDEVNASEVKIGARELPAVTQLFTEPYMVSFLLDNSLGAWWASRRLTESDLRNAGGEEELRQKAALPGVPLKYLRFSKVEAASSRFPPQIGYLHKEDPIANLTGNLPHWRQDGVTYFVTFRTADSLPQAKLEQWQREKEEWLATHPEPHDERTRQEFYELVPNRLQEWLDRGYGRCLLSNDRHKTTVETALKHFEGRRYHLDEYVVMPNHVHVLVTPLGEYGLSDILHSWKSFTASQINKATGQTGAFWQKESFDHIVRSPAQLEKIRHYIRNQSVGGRGEKHRGKRQDAASTIWQDAASTIWQPAAGTFDGWPEHLGELKTLDPCCGSGHFLVAAFLMLVPMRMELEGLSARESVDAVLRENLHGLEIDRRCVELAAFALALTAWRYPGAGGYRALQEMNLACSGLSVSVAREEWKQPAMDKHNLRIALDWMYDVFQDAPVLGSLLNPAKTAAAKIVSWDELSEAISTGLDNLNGDTERHEAGVVAHGLAKAATLLSEKYCWVITNVPYLTRGKQGDVLRDYCERHYPAAKNDLATVFLDRCLEFCKQPSPRLRLPSPSGRVVGGEGGAVSIVLPQNWLFLTSYKKFREKLLMQDTWRLVARLGPGAFETISGEVVKAALITLSRGNKAQDVAHTIAGLDVSELRTASEKAARLTSAEIVGVEQRQQLANPDARVVLAQGEAAGLMEKYASSHEGLTTGDMERFVRKSWELPENKDWVPYIQNSTTTTYFGGRIDVILWKDNGDLLAQFPGSFVKGKNAWHQAGLRVTQIGKLPITIYSGEVFGKNAATIIPHNLDHLPVLWCFCSSPEYREAVRQIDQSLKVTIATLVKVPFDLVYWTKVAQEKYPSGLPKPYSDDPTQWIFHGHPCGSVVWDEDKKWTNRGLLRNDHTVLQVAIARLLAYNWPAELDANMQLSDEQREWVNRCKALLPFADADGIVCIPPVRGEAAAADRLLNLLAAAYGESWSNDRLSELLTQADHAGKTLETWLRDKFFTQHCTLFHHRPFIWHIWDGLRDGFAALVNYHKLDRKNLETLIYTYLGDWIGRQKQDVSHDVDGAAEKLAAAKNLKKRLEMILEGEAPYDIFVRWKPIEQQPIGWDPDLNDGVRLNIRPFLSAPDVGKRGAGVLRDKPNINWNKDRGRDVPSAPWYHLGPQYGGNEGDRINDHHLALAEKRTARSTSLKETQGA